MQLIVNGEPVMTAANTLAALLGELGLADARVATALNGGFVAARARADSAAVGWRPGGDRIAPAGRLGAASPRVHERCPVRDQLAQRRHH